MADQPTLQGQGRIDSTSAEKGDYSSVATRFARSRFDRFRERPVQYLSYALRFLFHGIPLPVLLWSTRYREFKKGERSLLWMRLCGGSKPPYRASWLILDAHGLGELRLAKEVADILKRKECHDVAVMMQPQTAREHRDSIHGKSPNEVPDALILPFNNPISAWIFLNRWTPRAVIAMENWFIPHLAAVAAIRGVRTAVLNAMVRPRASHPNQVKDPWKFEWVDGYFCVSEEDRRSLISMAGVDPAAAPLSGPVCMLIDPMLGKSETPQEVRHSLRFRLRIDSSHFPIVIAGSTHHDEELILLEAFERLKQKFPSALLIMAPRFIDRVGGCDSALKQNNTSYDQLSTLDSGQQRTQSTLLVDRVGELKMLYSIGDVAFVGGSMAGEKKRAHSPVEAISWFLPVTIGPSYASQRAIVEELLRLEAVKICATVEALADAWIQVSQDELYRKRVRSSLTESLQRSDDAVFAIYQTICGN